MTQSNKPMSTNVGQPILVECPYTNQIIDLHPIVKYVYEHYDGDWNLFARSVDDDIRKIVDLLQDDARLLGVKNSIYQKFLRRDVISAVAMNVKGA